MQGLLRNDASMRPALVPTATTPAVLHRPLRRSLALCATASTNGPVSLIELLNSVAAGGTRPADALTHMQQSLGLSCAPTGPTAAAAGPRAEFPEVVYGQGKDAERIVQDLMRVAATQGVVLATLVDPQVALAVQQILPEVTIKETARVLVYKSPTVRQEKLPGAVAVIAAGSANEAVVEECRVMLQSLGCYVFTLGQAGVMGMHRMVQHLEAVRAADVVVVATGADASMVSIVAGMVDIPVIALPTSAGYGTAFSGVTPLLASLNSAAPGVTVVNVDSGFGASMACFRILKNAVKFRKMAAQN